jgi:hypothetical protein
VSILPDPTANNDEEQKAHLQQFARTIEEDKLSSEVFATILDEVVILSLSFNSRTNPKARRQDTWVFHLQATNTLRI